MPYPLANETVTFKGRRGSPLRDYFAREVEVHIFPANTASVIIDPATAQNYKYAVHWDGDDTLVDSAGNFVDHIAEGDTIQWSLFPGQVMALGPVFRNSGGDGAFVVLTAYFMPVAQGSGESEP